MVKRFTSILFLFLSAVLTISADTLPATFQWAHNVDGGTSGGDNTVAMCKSGDYYYIVTSFGAATNQSALNLSFDGELLKTASGQEIKGAGYEGSSGNSYTANLVLQKVQRDGTVVWTAYSNGGSIDWGGTLIAPLSDGSVALAVKSRIWSASETDKVCFRYNDPKDKVTEIASDKYASNQYVYTICKINPDGEFGDYTNITTEVKAYGDKLTKNSIYIYGLTTDENDNIYLGGNFTSTLTLDDTHSYEPRHLEGWSGDEQYKAGEMFVAKYGSDLKLQNAVVEGENTGSASCCQVDKLVYNDGKLYAVARVTNGSNVVFGGQTFSTSEKATPVIMSLDASDLTVDKLNALTIELNSKNKYDFKSYGMQYLNGKIYFLGSLNGAWKQGDETILENKTTTFLKGSILQINPEDCKVEKAAVRTTGGIGGFYAAFEGQDKLYVFGWDLTNGAVIAPISKESFEVETATTVCKTTQAGNATQPIVDGEYFVVANRGKASGTFYGTDKKFTANAWTSFYYCYKMSDVLSGISDAITENTSATTNVYTLGGIRVKANVPAAEATQGLAKGIYIVAGKKVVVK